MGQTYIITVSNWGCDITRLMAVSTVRALMNKKFILGTKFILLHWLQIQKRYKLWTWHSRRRKKRDITDVPPFDRGESWRVFNTTFCQSKFWSTSIEICFCLLDNISGKNSRQICIIGDSDKYSLTATFTITFDSRFLGMPLIYSEKTD